MNGRFSLYRVDERHQFRTVSDSLLKLKIKVSMSISIEEVDRIARLSRLRFSDAGKQKLAQELSQIVAYIDKLNELDLTEVPPVSQVIELVNPMRDDEAVPWFSPDQALLNAPSRHGNFFSVPKVIKID